MSECIYCDSELQMDSRMILCIEEHDITSTPSNLDTKLFIGWNSNEHENCLKIWIHKSNLK